MQPSSPLQVAVVGAGFAGLETALMLSQRAGSRVKVTLVTDRPTFLFRPDTIYIPFGHDACKPEVPIWRRQIANDIQLVEARACEADPISKVLRLAGDSTVQWDKLVIATGAAPFPAAIPGLAANATSIADSAGMLQLRRRLEDIETRAKSGTRTRIAVVSPPGNEYPAALYELVQMLDTHLRRRQLRERIELVFATHEKSWLESFGPRLQHLIAQRFESRGIAGYVGRALTRVFPGELHFADGTGLAYDELVTFPPCIASVRWSSLLSDSRGFLQCGLESRRVIGTDDVYAPGDAGDFPLKQAWLATLQADAVVEAIMAEMDDREPRERFSPVATCVVDQLDDAIFVRVPLRMTGREERPVELDPSRQELYRVGAGKAWRTGKTLLSLYQSRRIEHGEPLRGGQRSLVDFGLGAMARFFGE